MQSRRFIDGFEMHSELSPMEIICQITPLLDEYKCNIFAERIGHAIKKGAVSREDLEGVVDSMNNNLLIYLVVELVRDKECSIIRDETEYYPYMSVRFRRKNDGNFEVSGRDRSLNGNRASVLYLKPRPIGFYNRRRKPR